MFYSTTNPHTKLIHIQTTHINPNPKQNPYEAIHIIYIHMSVVIRSILEIYRRYSHTDHLDCVAFLGQNPSENSSALEETY